MKLTPAQAKALRKWVDHGAPAHHTLLKINGRVFDNLWIKGLVQSEGFLVRYPTEKGIAALEEYEAKRKP